MSFEPPKRSPSKKSMRVNDVIEVSIEKSATLGYGFSIMGGDPIEGSSTNEVSSVHISKLKDGAPAMTTGLLTIGQLVLAINDVSIVNATHKDVVEHLKQATGVVKLKLQNVGTRKTDVVLAQLGYERVRILFPFEASNKDEMSLKRGEVVFVEGKGTDGWCFGRCEDGREGMFPGQFALKLKPTADMLSLLADELETMSPGIYDRLNSEVLYEEIRKTEDGKDGKGKSIEGGLSVKKSSMSDLISQNSKDDPEDQPLSVYPMAKGGLQKMQVTLVGKEISARSEQSGTMSREHSYAPINDYGDGVVIYEPTFANSVASNDAAANIYSQSSKQTTKPPAIEDLYARVNKGKAEDGDTDADSTGYTVEITDDIYASIETTVAPTIPKRAYRQELLPPTMRVHVQEDVEDTYEMLPGQQEIDVDEVSPNDEVSPKKRMSVPRLSVPDLRQPSDPEKGGFRPHVLPTPSEVPTPIPQKAPPALPPMRKGQSLHKPDSRPVSNLSISPTKLAKKDKKVEEKAEKAAQKEKTKHEKESLKATKVLEKAKKKQEKRDQKEMAKEKKKYEKVQKAQTR